eukprot:gene13902-14020_t
MLDAAVLQALGAVSSLSRLELAFCMIESYASFAAALQKIPALQCIMLNSVKVVDTPSSEDHDLDRCIDEGFEDSFHVDDESGMLPLLHALAKDTLVAVKLVAMEPCSPAITVLQAASRLTSLVLYSCDVKCDDVTLLVQQLTQLRQLSLMQDEGANEGMLAAICSRCLQLTGLSFHAGAATPAAGLLGLSCLKQLRYLGLSSYRGCFDVEHLLQLSCLSGLHALSLDSELCPQGSGLWPEDAASAAVLKQLHRALPECSIWEVDYRDDLSDFMSDDLSLSN